MAARAAAPLYTPEMLALAVELAGYPPLDHVAARGEAVSRTCGSTIAIDLGLAPDDTVGEVGMRVSACAVGQAAAALFARGAAGRTAADIAQAERAVAGWLEGGALPEWPGIEAIAAARDYPGRHGAIALPWRAACAALSKKDGAG
ncbi:iron-sulfur cluster assembly scaffold protein [Pelagerythrobacter sp.]|uniref:iron-sulfur cluster assembly scaffold protein n=1 Tax=Pelagerythrobacter sp. TaxID=2800702 RepID=UPI0035AF461F